MKITLVAFTVALWVIIDLVQRIISVVGGSSAIELMLVCTIAVAAVLPAWFVIDTRRYIIAR